MSAFYDTAAVAARVGVSEAMVEQGERYDGIVNFATARVRTPVSRV